MLAALALLLAAAPARSAAAADRAGASSRAGGAAASCAGDAREIVLRGTGEAAVAQPTVAFELRDRRSGKPLAPRDAALGELLGAIRLTAILDTGASTHLLSSATAQYAAVEAEPGARYVETGVSGEHAMGVSRELGLALFSGDETRAARTFSAQRFLLNDAPTDLAALLLSPGSLVDVIGMPALRELVVAIEAGGAEGDDAIAVELSTAAPAAAVWVRLATVDFNRRRHPQNRGALPTAAPNPVVEKVRVRADANAVTGDWLLDTGSAVTMISTDAAHALGIVDRGGRPSRKPSFTVPVGGISGGNDALPGFTVDRIEIAAEDGVVIVFDHPAVVVHDVTTVADDGTARTLDGVLGMNLLLPSGSGIGPLGVTTEHAAPFTRVVIDGPRSRLGLTPAR